MLYQQIASNKRKTILVMTFFIALFGLIGAAIGYVYMSSMATGIIVALVVCGIYMFITMMQSTAIVMGMNNAQEITDVSQAPEILPLTFEPTSIDIKKFFLLEILVSLV